MIGPRLLVLLLLASWASATSLPPALQQRQSQGNDIEVGCLDGTCTTVDVLIIYEWEPNDWEKIAISQDDFVPESTGTAYIITIINTILNTTSVTTSLENVPTNFAAPKETDESGARIETFTYTRNGQDITTVVAYPTPFWEWPETYGLTKVVETTISGQPFCLSQESTATIAEAGPQPTGPFSVDPKDPFGWGYTVALKDGSSLNLQEHIDLLPESEAVPRDEFVDCEGKGLVLPGLSWSFDYDWFVEPKIIVRTIGETPNDVKLPEPARVPEESAPNPPKPSAVKTPGPAPVPEALAPDPPKPAPPPPNPASTKPTSTKPSSPVGASDPGSPGIDTSGNTGQAAPEPVSGSPGINGTEATGQATSSPSGPAPSFATISAGHRSRGTEAFSIASLLAITFLATM